MTSAQRSVALLAIVSLGFIARAATAGAPLFDHHSWRQADTAAIARNFATSRLNPLYPQIDNRGARPVGYVATGLELHAFLVALVAQVTGFATPIGRLLSALWYIGSALLVFTLTRGRYGDAAAFASAFIYSCGFPLVLFVERAFLNESLLLCLSFAVLTATDRYVRRSSVVWLIVAAVAICLIGAVKPTFLIVVAGVFALFLERYGWRGLSRVEPYVLVLVGALAAAAWLTWAAHLGRETGLTFGLTDKLFDAGILTEPGYWRKVSTRLLKDLFGPVGLTAGAIGAVTAWRDRRYMELALVAGGIVYLVVVTPGNYHHDYYQIPLVTGWTILAGLGLTIGLDRSSWFGRRAPATQLWVRVAAFWLLPITTLARSASPHNWYEIDTDREAMCRELKPALHGEDLLAFLDYQSPDIMFCLSARGWLIAPGDGARDRLDAALRDGATVIVSPRDSVHVLPASIQSATPLAATVGFLAFRVPPMTPTSSIARPAAPSPLVCYLERDHGASIRPPM